MAKCNIEKVKNEITELIAEKRISDAISLANDYLENYYWTMKEAKEIKQIILFLDNELNIDKNNKWFNSLSKINQLKEIFKDPNSINYEWFSMYNLSFDNGYPDEEINYLEYILKSKLYKNDIKLLILEIIQDNLDKISLDNNYVLKVYSSYLKDYISIDLSKWWPLNDDLIGKFEYYHNVKQLVNQYFFKNPSFAIEAEQIIKKICIAYLNLPTQYSTNELADQICDYIEAIYSFALNEQEMNKKHHFIISILNYFA